jgi:hypothetical protein
MTTFALPFFLVSGLKPPLKMSFEKFSALSLLELSSPKQKRTASIMLVFPLPFGPVIAVKPLSNINVVFLPNVLKPFTSIFFMKGIQSGSFTFFNEE